MRLTFWLAGFSYVYLLCLFGWLLLYGLFGDRWSWLFLLNSFALYLFVPLPFILLLSLWTSQLRLLIAVGAALVFWGYLYGWMIVPKKTTWQPGSAGVTVMTANLLGHNQHPEQAVAALRASNADIIGLQELNPATATAIQQELEREYPYQQLEPRSGDAGMGVISRYPLRKLDVELPGVWIGKPQVFLLEVQGANVLLLNMHAMSPRFSNMEWTIREREQQASTIANFIAGRQEPSIVVGDFNAGDLSRAYRTISGTLRDAWRAAGWGLGHTFPGADSAGSSRRIVAGFLAPMWLVRIDYVFYSDDWGAEWARIGPWDGGSDHRPVMARLVLRER